MNSSELPLTKKPFEAEDAVFRKRWFELPRLKKWPSEGLDLLEWRTTRRSLIIQTWHSSQVSRRKLLNMLFHKEVVLPKPFFSGAPFAVQFWYFMSRSKKDDFRLVPSFLVTSREKGPILSVHGPTIHGGKPILGRSRGGRELENRGGRCIEAFFGKQKLHHQLKSRCVCTSLVRCWCCFHTNWPQELWPQNENGQRPNASWVFTFKFPTFFKTTFFFRHPQAACILYLVFNEWLVPRLVRIETLRACLRPKSLHHVVVRWVKKIGGRLLTPISAGIHNVRFFF